MSGTQEASLPSAMNTELGVLGRYRVAAQTLFMVIGFFAISIISALSIFGDEPFPIVEQVVYAATMLLIGRALYLLHKGRDATVYAMVGMLMHAASRAFDYYTVP